MKEIKFRNLRADEITIRPTDTKYKGSCTLLLYKDARVDMDILDETVGPAGWQKEYYEVKGNVYCRIGIKTDDEWIWKSDCGVESNVDAVKGEASDAAKRAAVCWGIGRELYTGPRVKIKCPDSYYYDERMTMTFYVKHIAYDGKIIVELAIADRFDNIVFNWSLNGGIRSTEPLAEPVDEPKDLEWTPDNIDALKSFCGSLKGKVDNEELKKFYAFYEKRCSGWKNRFEPDKLWERWLTTSRKAS